MVVYPSPSVMLSGRAPRQDAQVPNDGSSFNFWFPYPCEVVKIWPVIEPSCLTVVELLWWKIPGNPEWILAWKMLVRKVFSVPTSYSYMLDLKPRVKIEPLARADPVGTRIGPFPNNALGERLSLAPWTLSLYCIWILTLDVTSDNKFT